MKLTITGYFDSNLELKSQIEVAKRNHLDTIALRAYAGHPLLEIKDAEIKTVLTTLKQEKLEIGFIDSNIKPYPMNSAFKHKDALEAFKHIIKLSNKLKTDYILLEIPQFHDVIEDFLDIKRVLEGYITQANIANKTIIIKPTKGYKSNVYAYIFNKLKADALMFAFDPVMIMQNGESVTTAYRILKKKIQLVVAHDANHDGNPELLGYGSADILNLFKRLIRDRFKGFVLADHAFKTFDMEYHPKSLSFFDRVFKKEKKRVDNTVQTLQKRLFPDDPTRVVTLEDIQDNQIKVLQVVFK